jgi:hypothetical protein
VEKQADISKRLGRLINGKGEPRDFDAFFLWVRATRRSHGNRIIEDIGHFVAHADERTKGASWKRVSHIAAMVTFILPRLGGVKNQTLTQLKEALEASLDVLSDEEVRAFAGISKASAAQIMKQGLLKIESFDGSNMTWCAVPSRRERALIKWLLGIVSVQPAFTEDELFSEFTSCVSKNSLVDQAQLAQLERLRPLISLYATEKMHLSRIALRDGRTVAMAAHIGTTDSDRPVISVAGTVPVELDGWTIPIMFNVYTSTLQPERWCDQELLLEGSLAWEFPLEIGSVWKLQMLP